MSNREGARIGRGFGLKCTMFAACRVNNWPGNCRTGGLPAKLPARTGPPTVKVVPASRPASRTRPRAPPVTPALVAIQSAYSPTVKAVPAIQPASRSFGNFSLQRHLRGMLQKLGTLEAPPPAVCGKLGKLGTLETAELQPAPR